MSKLENNTASLETVMSKINGLNNEINSQATTIAEIAELLNGKSVPGGTASVETCTVTISGSNSVGRPYYISAIVFENGKIEPYFVRSNEQQSITIPNVVCNSLITVEPWNNMYTNVTGTNIVHQRICSTSYPFGLVITAPNQGEAKAIIYLNQSGGGN